MQCADSNEHGEWYRRTGDGRCVFGTCEGDVDGDGMVGFADVLAVLAAWGPCPDCPEDLDDDDVVDFGDLLIVLAAWGPC